jgi:hypothetical protein
MEQELEALQRLDEGKNMQNKTEECGIVHVTAGDWKREKVTLKSGVLLELQYPVTIEVIKYHKANTGMIVNFHQNV